MPITTTGYKKPRKKRSDAGVPRRPRPIGQPKTSSSPPLPTPSKQKEQEEGEKEEGKIVQVDIPAVDEPSRCQCWSSRASETDMWLGPEHWTRELFAGIYGTPAYSGAKARMCGLRSGGADHYHHRKMHISLKNGEIRIDLPLLSSPSETTTYYCQHWYCGMHRRFERRLLLRDRPPLSPIVWFVCKQ
jgi:hypothetical protein